MAEAISALGDKIGHETNNRSLFRADRLKIKQQGQVKLMWKQKPWIRQWASRAASCVLFLHGDGLSDEEILSYIAARILENAEKVRQPSKVIVLRHFCSENRKHGDRAVLIMIQCLLRQLLSQLYGADSLDLPSGTFSEIDSRSLTDTFEAVVRKLREDMTVICVVDSLHSYCDKSNSEARAREAEEMFPRLVKLASGPCRFKLLLTASNKNLASRISREFGIGEDVSHAISHEALDRQGFKDRFWTDNQLAWMTDGNLALVHMRYK